MRLNAARMVVRITRRGPRPSAWLGVDPIWRFRTRRIGPVGSPRTAWPERSRHIELVRWCDGRRPQRVARSRRALVTGRMRGLRGLGGISAKHGHGGHSAKTFHGRTHQPSRSKRGATQFKLPRVGEAASGRIRPISGARHGYPKNDNFCRIGDEAPGNGGL